MKTSWLQILIRVTEWEDGTTAKNIALLLKINDAHVQVVLNRLFKWGLVKRKKGQKTTGRGRPSYLYELTQKGELRLERAEAELGPGWWDYPDTRPPEKRRVGEPPYGSPEWDEWKEAQDSEAEWNRGLLQYRLAQIHNIPFNLRDEGTAAELRNIRQDLKELKPKPRWFERG